MSIELLNTIIQTENEADEIRKKSHEEGVRILAAAKEEGSELIRGAEKAAGDQAEIILEQSRQKTEMLIEAAWKEVKLESARISENAGRKLDETAQMIVERIVSKYVCDCIEQSIIDWIEL